MANEVRLIDADKLRKAMIEYLNVTHGMDEFAFDNCFPYWIFAKAIEYAPTVDAVEASRLGYLGRLMMPYNGCPRGRMGARGDGRIIELDPIKDVEGDIWVPVLEEDLNFLKAKAVEVVHGRWVDRYRGMCSKPMYECSECEEGALYTPLWDQILTHYCPNCGAKMCKNENP